MLHRQLIRQRQLAGLDDAVRLGEPRVGRGDAAKLDDAAVPASQHMGDGRLSSPVIALDIDLHHPVDLGLGGIKHSPAFHMRGNIY